jgi:hypothetical protein
MSSRPADELFYDSEAMLRLVDRAIDELRVQPDVMQGASAHATHGGAAQADLPHLLLRAYSEVSGVLSTLRRSRRVLERTTVEKAKHTDREAGRSSPGTELPARELRDALQRALTLAGALEAANGPSAGSADFHAELRDELAGALSCVQFEEITSQQLNYVSSVLFEAEDRIADLVRLFDPEVLALLAGEEKEGCEIVSRLFSTAAVRPAPCTRIVAEGEKLRPG